ncbi:helix-turn-helix transcriptional regulator [Aminobacter sp. SR38]|uniref:helix-turn-helix domain-containing protein n=1 Tax=Aminobacter sp. SR38 TaxID=2774562 RepID=UPI00177C6782|nr:XRE family transcriptional regulator [Aminobacter sp. SR38]QOF73362.1 helix-turn-helix transcriptional regulator [Aminobacter sp. SR38]
MTTKKTNEQSGAKRKTRVRPSRQSAARAPLEVRIGQVLRNQRTAANLTLADVSAGAGISSAMLSRIENGAATASLDSLEKLCEALGIGMADLFHQTDEQKGSAQLIKQQDQVEVVRIGTKHGHTYKLLAYGRGPRKTFEPFFIEMDKKSRSYPRFSHPGTEFIYMLQGRVEYRFGEHTYVLEPGDAFTFSGHVVHGPERMLDEYAKFLSIIIYNE